MHRFRLIGLVLSLAACQGGPRPGLSPTPSVVLPEPLPVVELGPLTWTRPGSPVERLIDTLPVRDLIAQLVVPWVAGGYAAFDEEAFTRTRAWVDSLHVGGVIISIGSPLDLAWKLNRLQEASVLPLLVAADFEGGTALRLAGGTPFPTNMGVGAAGGELDAYQMGRITALEGRAVGVHLALAPVADVNSNPANPIINTRSFGEDPQAVARLVTATIRGFQDHGMLATAKHFPGHGDTETDSHIALPILTADWARFDSLELVPFRAAVAAGVEVVMSAHIALPGLDSGRTRPATLAPTILTGILRDSLGFQGLAVTDALNMGAVVNGYGAGEAVVQAFLAGADLLIQPADPREAIDAMADAVASGRISRERLTRSVRRVLLLKQRLGLFRRRSVPLDSVPFVVGRADFLATARDIAQRAVVLVADHLGTVDSLRRAARSLTLVTYGDENSPAVGTILAAELRAAGHSVSTFRLWPASGPASLDSARTALARNEYAVFAAAVRATAWRGTISLPDAVARLIDSTAGRRRTVLVSLGSPYLLNQTPRVTSYLLAWASNPVTEWAVARALSGGAPISGHLPISLPPRYSLGFGLSRPSTHPVTP